MPIFRICTEMCIRDSNSGHALDVINVGVDTGIDFGNQILGVINRETLGILNGKRVGEN